MAVTQQNKVENAKPGDGSQPTIKCRVCGALLYSTDHGNHEVTYHCSSAGARFWDFERGSAQQIKAKEHWDNSRTEVFSWKDEHL